jgi:hypothetical protein
VETQRNRASEIAVVSVDQTQAARRQMKRIYSLLMLCFVGLPYVLAQQA